jgi:hypothetical protein
MVNFYVAIVHDEKCRESVVRRTPYQVGARKENILGIGPSLKDSPRNSANDKDDAENEGIVAQAWAPTLSLGQILKLAAELCLGF